MTEVKPNNLYFFFGEEGFLVTEKVMEWKKRFVEKYGDINLQVVEGEKLRAGEVSELLNTAPFLSEKKLVIVRGFLAEGDKDEQKKVMELLNDIPEFTIAVFAENGKPDARLSLTKYLQKSAKVEEFKLLTGSSLVRWVKERAVKNWQKELPESVAGAICEAVGPNLWNLSNELEKLFLYAGEKPVDLVMVRKLISPNPQSTVFKLTDYLGGKDLPAALQTLEILIESGEEMMGVLFMLVRHFRVMVQVQELLAEGLRAPEIAAKIKEHPFVVSKMVGQSRNFTRPEIAAIYARLAAIDQGVKTGRIRLATGDTSELEQAMEMMMVELCG